MKPISSYGRKGAALMRAALLGAAALALVACEGAEIDSRPYEKNPDGTWSREGDSRETIFGKGGLDLFGGGKADEDIGRGAGVNVNAYLWRASLDTISFMPLSSADPFGGVIITDWYTPPENTAERFKVNVYILGRALRTDGLKVSVFRQVKDATGNWRDVPVADGVATELENAVLTRARQLRMAAAK